MRRTSLCMHLCVYACARVCLPACLSVRLSVSVFVCVCVCMRERREERSGHRETLYVFGVHVCGLTLTLTVRTCVCIRVCMCALRVCCFVCALRTVTHTRGGQIRQKQQEREENTAVTARRVYVLGAYIYGACACAGMRALCVYVCLCELFCT